MHPTLVFPPELEIPPTTAQRSIVLIGRHPQCDVVLKSSAVSRRHCVLVETENDLIIRDLGSQHGVWVNGKRVEEAILNVGDEIAIGPVIVAVVDPDELAQDSIGDSIADSNADSCTDSTESTECADDRHGLAGKLRVCDPGLVATEPIRPPTAGQGDAKGIKHGPDVKELVDPDDKDIPSDSKLEVVL